MSIFSALKPKAKLSKNSFDLSRNETFSLKAGMLTPCMCLHTIPNSSYQIDVKNIIRTAEMQTANFVGMSQNIDFFFVPYSQLYSGWHKFYDGRGDEQHNFSSDSELPRFNLLGVILPLYQRYFTFRFFLDIFKGHMEELPVEDYDSNLIILISVLHNQGLCTSELANVIPDDDFNRIGSSVDSLNRVCLEDQLRLLDMLGYGNYLPMFKNYYNYVLKNVCDNLNYSLDDLRQDIFGANADQHNTWASAFSTYLADMYDLDNYRDYKEFLDGNPIYVSAFPLMAYLKIYDNIFRNVIYDDTVVPSPLDAAAAAYSKFFNRDYGITNFDENDILELLKPRYHQYKKDMVTGCYPSSQFGSAAIATLNNPSQIFSTQVTDHEGQVVVAASSGRVVQKDSGTYYRDFTIDSGVSALQMRQAFAIQSYRELILRAGDRAKNLQEAQFGDVSKYILDTYVDFLGSFSGTINSNPVAATAEGDGVNIGDLGAYGVSNCNGNPITYHCHDFGMIIAIAYILPETKYENFGIDRHLTKLENTDFFNAKFENLGLAPVFKEQLSVFDYDAEGQSNDITFANGILGYLARYSEYKTAISHVHGEFFGSVPVPSDLDSGVRGVFCDFTTPRKNYETLRVDRKLLYISPDDLDSIFYLADDFTQASDQFRSETYFQVKALLPMSVTGLPSL